MTAPAVDRQQQERDALVEAASAGLAPAEAAYLRQYYRHVAPLDLAGRDPREVAAAALSHLELARRRPAGSTLVSVTDPQLDGGGWSCPCTVVQIATDDMPFIVDSVTAELTRQGLAIHHIVHPQLRVRRDAVGALVEVLAPAEPGGPDVLRESLVCVEVDPVAGEDRRRALRADLRRVLEDVRAAHEDGDRMRRRIAALATGLEEAPPVGVTEAGAAETAAFLRWMAAGSFTFLGAREYDLRGQGDDLAVLSRPGSGLGILRDAGLVSSEHRLVDMAPDVREQVLAPRLLTVTKANSRATVGRPAFLDYVGVRTLDAQGRPVAESRFLGLLDRSVYTASARTIPVVRRRVAEVLEASGLEPGSHDWNDLLEVLETYPRDELFQADAAVLAPRALQVLQLQDRRRVALVPRRDPLGRFVSCLVFLPRDRFTTQVRQEMEEVLREAYAGAGVESTTRLTESVLARLHVVVRADDELLADVDVEAVRQRLESATRTWEDDLAAELARQLGPARAAELLQRWPDAYPEAYKEDFPARIGALDLDRLDRLPPGELATALYRVGDERRFKIFLRGRSLSLSELMPLLQALGVEVTDERPYGLRAPDGEPVHVYDIGLRRPGGGEAREDDRPRFEEAFAAVWSGLAESDGLNALVLAGGLAWHEVAVLRALSRYLRQIGSTFSQDYIAATLVAHADLARLLLELFRVRFDPAFGGDRGESETALVEQLHRALDTVSSLDEDRILRALLGVVRATVRTNAYRPGRRPEAPLALKLDPHAVPGMPAPVPTHEIWVCSPRVEGVHLRFGRVARGGLRWSDRREDFRTEVLGLVKAQTVKNTVIVPTGAKGGFVLKRPPADAAGREALQAEGVACYAAFVGALLDVTDDLREGGVVAPPGVVRHDADDPYLVVAADKGTATFSDVANAVAIERGFWLGDAFASGGSAGYDHKRMGITARGAWESVKRHFRELGLDVQREPVTAVGIGDMSGDVFGNGMLLSPALRLVAAFDHRHVFVDPEPDAAVALAERRRLAALPRSSWDDYDRGALSTGGGVWPRTAKSIPVAPEAARALGLPEGTTALTPAELVRAVLLAPVDLLWNGGIGTYVKASTEPHAAAGDRANDAVRVDGRDLRCRVVGEGGNLGLTQAGRVEYALAGGRVYTDAIDNSAGVDTSDHEVNIKILLNGVVDAGLLAHAERDALLAAMTDEVAALVLRDNYEQTLALEVARRQAPLMSHVHADWVRALEQRAGLDRGLEGLPSDAEVAARRTRGAGFTTPELAVLLAYTKIWLADAVLHSDVPEDRYLHRELLAYFPEPMREPYAAHIESHRLHREIVVTRLVNRFVNYAGITCAYRLSEELGAAPADVLRAWMAAADAVGARELTHAIETLDTVVPAATQTAMQLRVRQLVERSARWLLQARPAPLDAGAVVAELGPGVRAAIDAFADAATGHDRDAVDTAAASLRAEGVPAALARRMATLPLAAAALDVVDVARRSGRPVPEVVAVWLALDERMLLGRLRELVLALPRASRWETLARAALREDLQSAHASLVTAVLGADPPAGDADAGVRAWLDGAGPVVERALAVLADVVAAPAADVATLSVALRAVRSALPPVG